MTIDKNSAAARYFLGDYHKDVDFENSLAKYSDVYRLYQLTREENFDGYIQTRETYAILRTCENIIRWKRAGEKITDKHLEFLATCAIAPRSVPERVFEGLLGIYHQFQGLEFEIFYRNGKYRDLSVRCPWTWKTAILPLDASEDTLRDVYPRLFDKHDDDDGPYVTRIGDPWKTNILNALPDLGYQPFWTVPLTE